MKKSNFITALKVSQVVGSLLNIVNNSSAILENNITMKLVFKIVFTYSVTFCVSLYSAYTANKLK